MRLRIGLALATFAVLALLFALPLTFYNIHAVGPKFQEEDTEVKLRTTMRNTLSRAEEKKIKRLALPAMGAGYYGIPPELCARVMLEELERHLEGGAGLEEVIICVLDTPQYTAFRGQLAKLG